MDIQTCLTYFIVAVVYALVGLTCLDAGKRISNGFLGIYSISLVSPLELNKVKTIATTHETPHYNC